VSVFIPESGGMRLLGEFDQPLNAGESPSAPTYKAAMTQALSILDGSALASKAAGQTSLTLTITIPDVKYRFQALSVVRTVPDVVFSTLQDMTTQEMRVNVGVRGDGQSLQDALISSGYTLKALDDTTWEVGQE
ncbi:MAG: hypothetical protein ACKO57_03755, partial [Alphaproteobacteria bacterium]